MEDIGPGMSAAWFDYDGDGRPDLYVSNMWTDAGQRVTADAAFRPAADDALREAYRRHTKGNSLYRNRGDGTFAETAPAEGVEMGRWAWGADALDFDNDGAPEIYVTCGMLTGPKETDLMSFFWRQVVAKSPTTAVRSEAYENGWNAINQLIREDYSWNGREPNVFYVAAERALLRLLGRERTRLRAGQPRVRGHGSRRRRESRYPAEEQACAAGEGVPERVARAAGKSIAVRLTGTKSNRDAVGRAGGGGRRGAVVCRRGRETFAQHTKTLHFGVRGEGGGRESDDCVAVGRAAGIPRAGAPGIRYDITEGSAEFKKTAFAARAMRRGSGHG